MQLTRFMIKVRSPAWSSSSGVGGSGRLGGPPLPWLKGVVVLASSETGPKPGLYENSGLNVTKTKKAKNKSKTKKGRQIVVDNGYGHGNEMGVAVDAEVEVEVEVEGCRWAGG